MEVVVHVPDFDRPGGFGLGGERAGVEQFLGEDPLVTLYLPLCLSVNRLIS